MAPAPKSKSSSSTVSYKDAFRVGLICGIAVLITSIVVTRAWLDLQTVLYSLLYAAIAFVVVTATAAILNWVMRNDTQNQDQTYPVMR